MLDHFHRGWKNLISDLWRQHFFGLLERIVSPLRQVIEIMNGLL